MTELPIQLNVITQVLHIHTVSALCCSNHWLWLLWCLLSILWAHVCSLQDMTRLDSNFSHGSINSCLTNDPIRLRESLSIYNIITNELCVILNVRMSKTSKSFYFYFFNWSESEISIIAPRMNGKLKIGYNCPKNWYNIVLWRDRGVTPLLRTLTDVTQPAKSCKNCNNQELLIMGKDSTGDRIKLSKMTLCCHY